MHRPTAEELIEELRLEPLEGEGGYFRRTWYREDETGAQLIGSCILYLVTPGSFSSLHRLANDEIFHFYAGDPCESVTVDAEGRLTETVLGSDIMAGMKVQHIVPGGTWQGTRLATGGSWALLGTTMAPGFHPSGFELATVGSIEGFSPDVVSRVREFIAPHP